MNIKNLLDHTRLLKFGNGTDPCNSDYPVKGYDPDLHVYTCYLLIIENIMIKDDLG